MKHLNKEKKFKITYKKLFIFGRGKSRQKILMETI